MSHDPTRRRFLRTMLGASAGVAAFGPSFWQGALAQPAEPGPGPYGTLRGRAPDANGMVLPEGFRSRIVARSGETVGEGSRWHDNPDGGAAFPTDDGGWLYVSNSEVDEAGGVSAVRFSPEGEILGAQRILHSTTLNCAGGPTPWGTWLSCEEFDASDDGGDAGHVWECDPSGRREAIRNPAMGAFAHEAVAVDPRGRRLYLTEDQPDGRLYRFTPARWPRLEQGLLEVAAVAPDGAVAWRRVQDPSAAHRPTRYQVPESTAFDGGEGIWFDAGWVYFTTKGTNVVRRYDPRNQRLSVIYDASRLEDPPLTGVDNITASPAGDLLVAEDGGDMELVLLSPERTVTPFLRLEGHEGSELAGPAFDPSGRRLYVSSRTGPDGGGGVTYEIEGPFRGADAPVAGSAEGTGSSEHLSTAGAPEMQDLVAGGAVATSLLAGAWWLRRRTAQEPVRR